MDGEILKTDTPSVSLVSPELTIKINEKRVLHWTHRQRRVRVQSLDGRPGGRRSLACCPTTPVVFHGKTLSQKAADEGSDWELRLGPSHAAARPQVEQKNKDVKKVDGQ